MTLNRAFRLRTVAAEDMLIDTRGGVARLDKVFRLSPAAAWLWNKASGEEDFSEENLVAWLCEEYDVSLQDAQNDVRDLLADWIKYGIVA